MEFYKFFFIICKIIFHYYQRSREVILNRAKDYYENNKELLRERAKSKYRNYLKRKKNMLHKCKRVSKSVLQIYIFFVLLLIFKR